MNLVIREMGEEKAVFIVDGKTRNSQTLRGLIEIEKSKGEELTLLTIVKLWKRADKISQF